MLCGSVPETFWMRVPGALGARRPGELQAAVSHVEEQKPPSFYRMEGVPGAGRGQGPAYHIQQGTPPWLPGTPALPKTCPSVHTLPGPQSRPCLILLFLVWTPPYMGNSHLPLGPLPRELPSESLLHNQPEEEAQGYISTPPRPSLQPDPQPFGKWGRCAGVQTGARRVAWTLF